MDVTIGSYFFCISTIVKGSGSHLPSQNVRLDTNNGM